MADNKLKISRNGGTSPVPLIPMPQVSSYPQTLEGRKRLDEDLDLWRKAAFVQRGNDVSLKAGAGVSVPIPTTPTPTTVQIPGPKGDKGDKGEQGIPGPVNVYRIHYWIAKRTDGKAGAGNVIDPFDGSTQAKFDQIMRSLPAYSVIHLGEGVFQTKGSISGTVPLAEQWRVRPGWQILGSGIDNTTLQLVGAELDDNHYFIIFNNANSDGYVEDVVIDGLTLDCNLAGQPGDVLAGALVVSGDSIRISNLRVINWGSKSPSNIEAFVVGGTGGTPLQGDTFSYLVENIRIEAPAQLHASGGGTMMDFSGGENLIESFVVLTRSGSTATATLGSVRHSLKVGAWVKIRNSTATEYNGSFQVTEVVDAFVFKYEVPGTPAAFSTGLCEHHEDYGNGRGVMHGLIIRDCVLDCTPYVPGIHGITLGGVSGAIVEDNTILDVEVGIYMDFGFGESMLIRRNVLQGGEDGIQFNLATGIVDTLIVEDNLIELAPLIANTGTFIPQVTVKDVGSVAYGIFLRGLRTSRPLTFRQLIVRGNIIRYAGQASGTTFEGLAFLARGVESLILKDNIIGLSAPEQLTTEADVLSVIASGNRTMEGKIILLKNEDALEYFDPDIDAAKIHKLAVLNF